MSDDTTPISNKALSRKVALTQLTNISIPAGMACLLAWGGVKYFYSGLDSRVGNSEEVIRVNGNRITVIEAQMRADGQRVDMVNRRLERIEDKLDRALEHRDGK